MADDSSHWRAGRSGGPPLIVGLGGTGKRDSASERVLRQVLGCCELIGAETMLFDGPALDMPMYAPVAIGRDVKADRLVEALRLAQGVVISSPGYHGTISGLIKNALDYAEDMAGDGAPYLEGRAVGLIAVASGWQAAGTTLSTLRSITHALRGWPTPMAVAINSALPVFGDDGAVADEPLRRQLEVLAEQVVSFAQMRALHDLSAAARTAESDTG